MDNPKWKDNLFAALIFFTRIPFGRIYEPPKESYRAVIEYWPLIGWLTSGVMALIVYFGDYVFMHSITIIIAIIARILLTGALHEDGLADFFDGFGGGNGDRNKILQIMKDSHIGVYGVLSLTLYLILLFLLLNSLPPALCALTIFAADPFAKMLASQATMMLPYARKEEESKALVSYRRMNIKQGIFLFLQGILPLALLLYMCKGFLRFDLIIFIPGVVMYFLYLFIYKKIRGYTGDCCGAMFLLIELSFYFVVVAQYTTNKALWTLFS